MARTTWIAAGLACVGLILLSFLVTGRGESPRATLRLEETPSEPTPLEILTSTDPVADEEAPAERTEVEAGERTDLIVRVVDAEGRAVGGVVVEPGYGATRDLTYRVGVAGVVRTDERGLARFPGFLAETTEPFVGARLGELVLLGHPTKVFRRERLPRHPLTIRIPEAGALALRLVGPRGKRIQKAFVHLSLAPGAAEEPWQVFDRPRTSFRVRGGEALVPVPVGSRIQVLAQLGSGPRYVERVFAGPTRVGQTASGTIVMGELQPAVKLRALDGDGTPLAHTHVAAVVHVDGQHPEKTSTITGSGGELVLILDEPSSSPTTLDLQADGGSRTQVVLPAWLPAGVSDHGDVVFGPVDSMLVSGIVVGPNGEPLDEARVHVNQIGGGSRRWSRTAPTGEDGRFTVSKLVDDERVAVVAHQEGRRSQRLEVARGAEDVVLVMSDTGGLRGRVELGSRDVRGMSLALSSGSGTTDEQLRLKVRNDFQFTSLYPGTYTLRAYLHGEALAEVRDLVVVGGEVLTDARLDPLDLRGRFHVHEVLVHRANGVGIRGQLAYAPAGSAAPADWSTFGLGPRMQLASLAPAIDVEVRPKNGRMQRALGLSGTAEIELDRPLHVALRVSSAAPLPEADYLLEPVLLRDGLKVSRAHRDAYVRRDDPEVHLSSLWVGECEIAWRLHHVFGGREVSVAVDLGPRVVIDVRDVSEEQVFDVEIPGEELARLLANPPR